MRRGTIGAVFLILALMMVLRGGSDIDQQAFVSSIAIDPWEGKKLLVSLQIPGSWQGAEGNMETGRAKESSSDGYAVVEAVAYTFMDASEILNAALPRVINYNQVLQILISEELAQESGFTSLLDDIMRIKDMRSSAAVIICRGKAQDLLKHQKPFLGVRLSTNITTQMRIAREMGIIPSTNIGEVMRFCRGAWRDVIVPYGALNIASELGANIEKEEEGYPLDKPSGDMPQSMGANSVDYIGAALLRDGRMVGSLTGLEMQFLSFIMGNLREFTFFVDDVYYRIHQTRPASVQVIMGESGWTIRVTGRLQASVLQIGEANEDKLRDALTHRMLSLLRKLQALGVDPAGFEGKAVRSVRSISDWPHDRWMEGYQSAALEVFVHVTIGEVR